jgi:hypothetical protein
MQATAGLGLPFFFGWKTEAKAETQTSRESNTGVPFQSSRCRDKSGLGEGLLLSTPGLSAFPLRIPAQRKIISPFTR